MDIFNVKRRDVYGFDAWMNLKNPGFGGPDSAEKLRDEKGKIINKDRKLNEYQHKVERSEEFFSHEVYNPTYKAMGGDLIHKQEDGKNPYDYPSTYDHMGIATACTGKTNEGLYLDFISFVLESSTPENNEECEGCNEQEKQELKSITIPGKFEDELTMTQSKKPKVFLKQDPTTHQLYTKDKEGKSVVIGDTEDYFEFMKNKGIDKNKAIALFNNNKQAIQGTGSDIIIA